MVRIAAPCLLAAALSFLAAPSAAADEIGYSEIKAATERAARPIGPQTPDFKKAEPPKVERKPVNQSFGWEGGAPIATGRTAESESERDRQRDQAEQRFLTQRTLRPAAPADPSPPLAPAMPTVTLEGPGEVKKNEAAQPAPAATRMTQELAEQLRARKSAAGSARIVLDEISATGQALPGSAIDTAKP
jgi:hypothetical protein